MNGIKKLLVKEGGGGVLAVSLVLFSSKVYVTAWVSFNANTFCRLGPVRVSVDLKAG